MNDNYVTVTVSLDGGPKTGKSTIVRNLATYFLNCGACRVEVTDTDADVGITAEIPEGALRKW
jgi:MinD-like ATPase involved in chromosome partitioning or flagellar assembly